MSDAVLFEEREAVASKKIGIAQLNAEKSLNALSQSMVDLLLPQMQQWQADNDIVCVFLHGAGEKAFCAGGDVVSLHAHSAAYGETLPNTQCADFFEKEYRLDYLIHTFTKPIIVWGNGFVMGGGMGLLNGASHRVVTESTRIAMPEITIGLYPDVGGSWFLNRTPGKTGLFLGLTGAQINGSDALYLNFADHFIADAAKEQVMAALADVANHRDVDQVLQPFIQQANALRPEGNIEAHIDWINEVCADDDLAAVVANITAYHGDDKWCAKAAKTLANGCPVTPYLVWQQLIRGQDLSLPQVFQMELTLSVNCARYGHFKEGVRALLIDKDRQPKWMPAQFDEVQEAHINAFFAEPWDQNPLLDLI
ncbi:enoyl-CoA hydratase/isomerase family protein [Bacterioplanoides sp. SCSIO 12839]|uniref:enoyl-CoA hydratase/isomerase family protein n=1 Tax=Bacterioplanoides sp. SCSIO 12839 TaxID=2829569 RepID=UPI002107A3F5|nr:enoyl-CoA hydratase/isomerase family protein [Bacterioplanoides sp. SCSIO 12839]UTW49633.1 enoyl-CoA hydratase/isomerase family protein [Bacterioplanoides sp. SCSIO 12839]